MKGGSRSGMKEENMLGGKTRIGTRSTGRSEMRSTRSPRLAAVASATSSRSPLGRSSRSLSPGTTLTNLRTKRARLEKEKDSQKSTKPVETALKQRATTPTSEQGPPTGSQSSQNLDGSQSGSSTPQGAGIRTRLSTGSIHMNGTMTISAAKEKAEMEQIIKQIAKSDSGGGAKTLTGSGKKRAIVTGTPSLDGTAPEHPPPKKRKIGRNDGSGEDNCNDYFCWLCHKEGTLVCCELCPRVYHTRCLGLNAALPQDWVCPECEKIMRAECVDTRSKSMEMLTIEQLCTLLKYSLDRMKHAGSEPFQEPVDLSAVPNYFDYIFHPMDLSTLEKNIKKKMYGCTEALLADAKWIQHNCIIYNGAHSKLTSSAKMIIKICKHEMNEIELCPDCYLNSCVRKNDEWFSETCRVPHTLVWAKLKGYPFWPSKALREVDGQVDVRFFGAHDRSWVPVSQCFLLSKNIPTSLQKGKKNNGLDMAIEELNIHVKKLRERFGGFEYAPFRTPYDKTDSYKPINPKSETFGASNAPIHRLSQNKDGKATSTSSLSSLKPNILRDSAVAKIRNKYNAMVSLKKIDSSPDKMKRKVQSTGIVEYTDRNTSVGEDIEELLNKDSEDSEVESKHIESDIKVEDAGKKVEGVGKPDVRDNGSDASDEKFKEKSIKKSFVSSNLIERIENKLKALDDEPDKDLTNSKESVDKLDVSVTEKLGDTPAKAEKEILKSESKPESNFDNLEAEILASQTKLDVNSDKGEDSNDESGKTEENTNKCAKKLDHENESKKETLNKVFETKELKNKDVGSKDLENMELELENQDLENKALKSKESETQQLKDKESESKDSESKESDKGLTESDKTSKDSYRTKLETMIKSCKEKLGMDIADPEDIDSAVSDEDEDDDNEAGSSDDEDDNSEDDGGSSESETEDSNEEQKEVTADITDTDNGVVEKERKKDKAAVESTGKKINADQDVKMDTTVEENKDFNESVDADVDMSEKDEKKIDKPDTAGTSLDKSELSKQSVTKDTKQDDLSDIGKPKTDTVTSDTAHPQNANETDNEAQGKISSESSSEKSSKPIIAKSPNSSQKTLGVSESSGNSEIKVPENPVQGDKTNILDKQTQLEKPIKSYLEKVADQFSGEFSDRTTEDDSDTDRLVIDLEDLSPLKPFRTKEHLIKADKTNTSPNMGASSSQKASFGENKETKLIDNRENEKTDSKKESERTDSNLQKDLSNQGSKSKCDSVTKEKQNVAKVNIMKKVSSNNVEVVDVLAEEKLYKERKQKEASKTKEEPVKKAEYVKQKSPVVPSTSSNVREKSSELLGMLQPKGPDGNKRETARARSESTPSVEEMEVIEAEGSHTQDEASSMHDSEMNMDSSLPVKNFVNPHIIDVSQNVPTSTNLAEKFSKKLMSSVQSAMEDMYEEMMQQKNDSTSLHLLNKKLTQAKWDFKQELNELKHNFQLTIHEMKTGWGSEKEQIVKTMKAQFQTEKETLTARHQAEKEQAIKETKKKQWCSQCGKEAIFYCCWNTSYCDYPCQQSHWPQHMHTCLQTNKDKTNTTTSTTSQGESSVVSQSASSIAASVGPSVTPISSANMSASVGDQDHLKQLQDNISRALQREEEKRGEGRPGVSPKFNPAMSTQVMQNVRQPGAGGMMFNMQPPPQPNIMQQMQRTRFIGQQQVQQQMAMQVQPRSSMPPPQAGNPRMLFSQPLVQHAVYPIQVQPQQQLGGTILFQNGQQMSYGMPPRPY